MAPGQPLSVKPEEAGSSESNTSKVALDKFTLDSSKNFILLEKKHSDAALLGNDMT